MPSTVTTGAVEQRASAQMRKNYGLPSEQRAALLRELFDTVAVPGDWKAPIDKVIDEDMVQLYSEAVKFMTAAPVVIVHEAALWPMVRLTCIGYRAGPAGP